MPKAMIIIYLDPRSTPTKMRAPGFARMGLHCTRKENLPRTVEVPCPRSGPQRQGPNTKRLSARPAPCPPPCPLETIPPEPAPGCPPGGCSVMPAHDPLSPRPFPRRRVRGTLGPGGILRQRPGRCSCVWGLARLVSFTSRTDAPAAQPKAGRLPPAALSTQRGAPGRQDQPAQGRGETGVEPLSWEPRFCCAPGTCSRLRLLLLRKAPAAANLLLRPGLEPEERGDRLRLQLSVGDPSLARRWGGFICLDSVTTIVASRAGSLRGSGELGEADPPRRKQPTPPAAGSHLVSPPHQEPLGDSFWFSL
ncbi:unnamed protein product [Lepidochelys kempii]